MRDENNVLFREVQRFPAWLRLLIVVSMALAIALAGFVLDSMFALDESLPRSSVILTVALGMLLPAALSVLILFVRLETLVRPDGLYVRLFPLHIKFKKFTGDEIAEHYPCTYKPIRDYGGWGIRYGLKGKKAYNLKGNRGLQLVFKSGKKLLIGSQKPNELANAISRI